MSTSIHFSEVSSLLRYINGIWSDLGPSRLIALEDIAQFGRLTQNEQWIHSDKERCQEESPYGDIIAHGLYLLTLIPSLLPPETFRVIGHKQRIVRGCNHSRFPAPAYVGDYVSARSKLLRVDVATSGKGVILTRHIEVVTNSNTKPVVTAELLLQYF